TANTVFLDGPAPPPSGATVALQSTAPGVATVGTAVVVPVGQTQATFPASAVAVTTQSVTTIAASYGGVSKSSDLTVKPLTVSTLAVTPAMVKNLVTANASVSLIAAAP